MPQYVKVGGTWRTVEETTKCGSVKVSGTWRDVQNSYVKVAGVWRSVCSTSPEVLLTLTNTDSGGQYNVRLDWTNINIVQTGAEIYKNGSFIASVGASTFTFTDSNLACGTTYTYYVRVNGSLNSNTVSRTTPACPPPTTTTPTTTTTTTTSTPTTTTTTTTTTEPPITTYYAAACCNGSVSLYANTTSCAAAQTYFNNNCTTVSNFACNVGGGYPSITCVTCGPCETYTAIIPTCNGEDSYEGIFQGTRKSCSDGSYEICVPAALGTGTFLGFGNCIATNVSSCGGSGGSAGGPCPTTTTTTSTTTSTTSSTATTVTCGPCEAYSFTQPTCNGEDSYVGNYTGYRRSCSDGSFSTSGCSGSVFNGYGALLDANSSSCGGSGTTTTTTTTSSEPVTTSSQPVTTSSEPVTTSSEPVTTSSEPVTTTSTPPSYCESIGCFDGEDGFCIC